MYGMANPVQVLERPPSRRVPEFVWLLKSNFHGCAYGLTNKQGQFMKKPWTLATTNVDVARDVVRTCDGTHMHVVERGKDCKGAEEYTVDFAKHVHVMLKQASATPSIMIERSSIDACPAIPIAGAISNAIQGSLPKCGRFPAPPSPFFFSSALSLTQSLAQAPHQTIRQDHLLPCCATTTARGEYAMSPSTDCHKRHSDHAVKGRRGVAHSI